MENSVVYLWVIIAALLVIVLIVTSVVRKQRVVIERLREDKDYFIKMLAADRDAIAKLLAFTYGKNRRRYVEFVKTDVSQLLAHDEDLDYEVRSFFEEIVEMCNKQLSKETSSE